MPKVILNDIINFQQNSFHINLKKMPALFIFVNIDKVFSTTIEWTLTTTLWNFRLQHFIPYFATKAINFNLHIQLLSSHSIIRPIILLDDSGSTKSALILGKLL